MSESKKKKENISKVTPEPGWAETGGDGAQRCGGVVLDVNVSPSLIGLDTWNADQQPHATSEQRRPSNTIGLLII